MIQSINFYCDPGVKAFQIKSEEGSTIELFDQNGFAIREEKFPELLAYYAGCGCYTIHLVKKVKSCEEPTITRYVSRQCTAKSNTSIFISFSNW